MFDIGSAHQSGMLATIAMGWDEPHEPLATTLYHRTQCSILHKIIRFVREITYKASPKPASLLAIT
jgi:hypothetical protein